MAISKLTARALLTPTSVEPSSSESPSAQTQAAKELDTFTTSTPFGVFVPMPKVPTSGPTGPFGVIVPFRPQQPDGPLQELAEAAQDFAQGERAAEQGDLGTALQDFTKGIEELDAAMGEGPDPDSYQLSPGQVGGITYSPGGFGIQPMLGNGSIIRPPPGQMDLTLDLPPGVTATATSSVVNGKLVVKVTTSGEPTPLPPGEYRLQRPTTVPVSLPPGYIPSGGQDAVIESASGGFLKEEPISRNWFFPE